MKFFILLSLLISISIKAYSIQIVGSERLCKDLVILMGDQDDELELHYNDLISGQLVEEDKFTKMLELEDYVLKISTLHHNLCTSH
jgi:hypothetical protein